MLYILQALGWLAATLVDKQLLVTLLDVLSTLLLADSARQAQQQLAVHANVKLYLRVWTALLQKTLENFKESRETDAQVLKKVVRLMHCRWQNMHACLHPSLQASMHKTEVSIHNITDREDLSTL